MCHREASLAAESSQKRRAGGKAKAATTRPWLRCVLAWGPGELSEGLIVMPAVLDEKRRGGAAGITAEIAIHPAISHSCFGFCAINFPTFCVLKALFADVFSGGFPRLIPSITDQHRCRFPRHAQFFYSTVTPKVPTTSLSGASMSETRREARNMD